MDMSSLPIALYDLIGVLLPGLLAPGVFAIGFAWSVKYYQLNAALLLATSYVMGQVVQSAGRWVYVQVDKMVPSKELLTPSMKDAITMALSRRLSQTLPKNLIDPNLKDLCYSFVSDKVENYRVFTALSDLHRALGTLSLAGFGFLIASALGWVPGHFTGMVNWLLAGGALVMFALFSERMRFFRSLADRVVYMQFVATCATAPSTKESSDCSKHE